MKFKYLFVVVGLIVCNGMFAQQTERPRNHRKIYVARPGTLAELLTEENANQIISLSLQGKLNAIDFRYLRDGFTNLRILDISTASISKYAGKEGTHPGFHIYSANCIPAYAFSKKVNDSTYVGKTSLVRVILSDKTKKIEEEAFKGCTNLQICQIRKKLPPNLQSNALSEDISAVFIPTGSLEAYIGEKQWANFAFIEGEPVGAVVQIGKMGSLSSELIRKGIQPNKVNFLVISGKMDEADFALIRNEMPNLVSIDLSRSSAIAIPDYTFSQKKYLLKAILPASLKTIGQRAFSGCRRLSGTLLLPETVATIEFGAFMGCDNLRSVVATGENLTGIGDKLFGEEKQQRLVFQKEERTLGKAGEEE